MVALTQEEWRKLDDCILRIHTTETLEVMQQQFMEDLDGLIPNQKSFFDLCSCKDGQFYFSHPVSVNMTVEQITSYYKQYQFSDYVAWIFNTDQPIIYSDSDIVSNLVRENSLIYKRWMEPMGVYYSMGSTIVEHQIMFGSITLFRSREAGDFCAQEIEILRILNRHLSASFSMRFPNGLKKKDNETDKSLMKKFGLTDREAEIMELIISGNSNQQIGEMLFISENTVKKHINNLYRKLDVVNRSQLMTNYYNQASMLVDINKKSSYKSL